ncbi:MAG: Iron-responsive regulator Irr, partial [uncultured Rubellimicrobium sp.]
ARHHDRRERRGARPGLAFARVPAPDASARGSCGAPGRGRARPACHRRKPAPRRPPRRGGRELGHSLQHAPRLLRGGPDARDHGGWVQELLRHQHDRPPALLLGGRVPPDRRARVGAGDPPPARGPRGGGDIGGGRSDPAAEGL